MPQPAPYKALIQSKVWRQIAPLIGPLRSGLEDLEDRDIKGLTRPELAKASTALAALLRDVAGVMARINDARREALLNPPAPTPKPKPGGRPHAPR